MNHPALPDKPIMFEGVGFKWAKVLEYRKPRKGEYFLSGAVVAGCLAYNDLLSEYWVAEPVELDERPLHLHQYPQPTSENQLWTQNQP